MSTTEGVMKLTDATNLWLPLVAGSEPEGDVDLWCYRWYIDAVEGKPMKEEFRIACCHFVKGAGFGSESFWTAGSKKHFTYRDTGITHWMRPTGPNGEAVYQ